MRLKIVGTGICMIALLVAVSGSDTETSHDQHISSHSGSESVIVIAGDNACNPRVQVCES